MSEKETSSHIYETKLQNNIVIVSSKSVTLIDPYNTTKQQTLTRKKKRNVYASIRENRRKPSLLSYLELRDLSKIELAEENKTSSNKKSREVEARGAVCTRVG